MTYDVKAARTAARVRKVAALAACPDCSADKGQPCTDGRGDPTGGNHKARVTAAGRANQAKRAHYEDRNTSHLGDRDHYGRELVQTGQPPRHGGTCPRCGNDLLEQPVKTSHGWIHPACAPGANDE